MCIPTPIPAASPPRHERGAGAIAGVLVLALVGGAGLPSRAADEVQHYQQRLGQLFRQLDRNADGRLERDEVRANAYLQRHFDRLDRGSKGYLVPSDLR
jgi:hypothetical protein